MSNILITPPAVEPISLDEARAHLRVTSTAEDMLIGLLIASARETAEHELGRALIDQEWEQSIDAWPGADAELRLGVAQARAITSVTYVAPDRSLQTLDPAAYVLDATVAPGWLLPIEGAAWPATADVINAVRVRFVAGYGAGPGAVPASIRHWMLLHIGTGYANRESQVNGLSVAGLVNRYHAALLDPHRMWV